MNDDVMKWDDVPFGTGVYRLYDHKAFCECFFSCSIMSRTLLSISLNLCHIRDSICPLSKANDPNFFVASLASIHFRSVQWDKEVSDSKSQKDEGMLHLKYMKKIHCCAAASSS
jgi:hypothetical protein